MNIYMNKEYKLLQASGIEEIETMLNEYAGRGWVPTGGISLQQVNRGYLYTQTVVREKKDINEGNPDNGKQLLHG